VSGPRFHETPASAIRAVEVESVLVGGRSYAVERPNDWNALLEVPFVAAAFVDDEYLPYWAYLWPSAVMLADVLHREDLSRFGHALELGCGLGLPGLVALAKGLGVTFSDYDATALRFAEANARRNGFKNSDLLLLDWRHPPAGFRVPLIIGSDLLYEESHHRPLLDLVETALSPGGLFLLTDPNRLTSEGLAPLLRERGFHFATEPVGPEGTLYRVTRP